jgi:drug/metabolite transporter (DMT)-like permease
VSDVTTNQRPPLRIWGPPFIAPSALWGSSFLFIKVTVDAFSPVQIAFARLAIGAAILIAVVLFSGDRLPRERRIWGHLVVSSLFMHAIPFTLFPFGEERISSVLAGIWNATTPLFTVLTVLVVLPSEKAGPRRLLGLAVGFIGVVVVLAPWATRDQGSWIGSLACILAALCYAIGTPYSKRFIGGSTSSGVSLAAVQLLLGAVWLIPLMGFQPAPTNVNSADVGSLIALGALGTGAAFYLYWVLIRMVGASSTTTVTYVMPIWSTLLGVVVLGEALQWNEPVGALVILLGVAVSEGVLRRRREKRGEAQLPVP